MTDNRNLFNKVWDLHTVRTLPSGQTQLLIGLHLIHDPHQGRRDLGGNLLLQEMAGVADLDVFDVSGAGDALLERPLAAARDGVAVAERGQERFLPLCEYAPRRAIGFARRVVSVVGTSIGKARAPAL